MQRYSQEQEKGEDAARSENTWLKIASERKVGRRGGGKIERGWERGERRRSS